MIRFFSVLLVTVLTTAWATCQCDLAIDTVDEFDGTRLVSTDPFNIGYFVPSEYETTEGVKMVEEGKFAFTYSENDSISSFFMIIAAAERQYLPINSGFNVLLKLGNEQIVGLLNTPDRGTFDRNTNMRIYQHTCVVPLDIYYNLIHFPIEKIRIEYQGHKSTLTLTPEQQEKIRDSLICVGQTVGLFPVKP
ncbi:MAG: hypothetical protein R3350_07720 [Saprospiraceae bacterium]|nr:hypothetical protein [Saprospiraceae bacterium]